MDDHHFGYFPKLSPPPKCVFFQCDNVISNFKMCFFSVKNVFIFQQKTIEWKEPKEKLLCDMKNHVAASAHVGQLI
jgi:hypothetical protein